MPGLVTNANLTSWSSQVRWPWGEPTSTGQISNPNRAGIQHVLTIRAVDAGVAIDRVSLP